MQPESEATAGANTNSTNVYDPQLSTFSNETWKGAIIHLRGGDAWTSQTGIVTDHTGNHLTLVIKVDPYNPINAVVGSRYYLTGTLAALDTANEYTFDGTNLYLWTPQSDAPSAHTIEAKRRDYAFDLSQRSFVTIRGLDVFAASIKTDDASAHITIDSIHARYVSHFVLVGPASPFSAHTFEESAAWDSGIVLHGNHSTLANSEIQGSAGNGLSVHGDHHSIDNNLIHDTDYSGLYGASIFVGGTNLTITNNSLFETGRDAIHVHPDSGAFHNNEIAHNDIHHYGRLMEDEGGVYGCCLIDWMGSTVHHNWIHDLIPIDSRGFRVTYDAHPGAGIYFDNGSGNALIHHNVTWSTYDGIQLNGMNPNGMAGPSSNLLVYNNTIGPNQGAGSGSLETLLTSTASGTRLINDLFAGGPLFPYGGGYPNAFYANNVNPGTDPLFTDAAHFDFTLKAGSPALGAGQSIPGVTTTTTPDVGAYEGGAFTPGCTLAGCH
jgi:hypothetical protein